MWKFIKKYWAWMLAAFGFILGVILAREKSGPPPTIERPPKDPPPEEKPTDFVGEHKEEKKESDEKIDDMSRDDLVDGINDKYS